MSAESEPPVARVDRRKRRTRRQLVDAARRILVSRATTDVSIQDITDEADVGLGSFDNHFSSKAELFEVAAGEALEEYGQLARREPRGGLNDPAEIFALGVRRTAGLARTQPAVAEILVQAGEAFLVSDRGLAPRARQDISARSTPTSPSPPPTSPWWRPRGQRHLRPGGARVARPVRRHLRRCAGRAAPADARPHRPQCRAVVRRPLPAFPDGA